MSQVKKVGGFSYMGALSSFFGPNIEEGPFSPTDIPNLALWLDGNDPNNDGIQPANNTPLVAWFDKSGNNLNFSQEIGANQPLFRENFYTTLGSVIFDGLTDYFDRAFSPLLNTHDTAIFIVCTCNNPTATWSATLCSVQNPGGDFYGYTLYKHQFGDADSNKWQAWMGSGTSSPAFNIATGPTMVLNQRTLISISSSGGAGGPAQFFVDNVSQGSVAYFSILDGATVTDMRLGAIQPVGPLFYFPGVISEIIIYSRTLTSPEFDQVQNYLLTRWGI